MTLDEAIALYAWHCRHHTAHIEQGLRGLRAQGLGLRACSGLRAADGRLASFADCARDASFASLVSVSLRLPRAVAAGAVAAVDARARSTSTRSPPARGNAALVVFPDGTTMLVDAGRRATLRRSAGRATRSAARGSRTTSQQPGVARLDYALLTHFHADHIGGINDVGARLPIATVIDRGHDYLTPADDDPTFTEYRAFLQAQRARGTMPEAIRVGRADQIVLRRDRAAFPVGGGAQRRRERRRLERPRRRGRRTSSRRSTSLAAEDRPSENMCSIGLRMRYGRFDLFTGGDMPGVPDAGAPAWQSVETAVARAIGPTDVHVVNHHGRSIPRARSFCRRCARR